MKPFLNFKKITSSAFSLFLFIFLLSALLFPNFVQATAGVPALINFQGRLMNSSSVLLGGSGTDYCFKFSIYDATTAGSKIWPSGAPTPDTLVVREGVFDASIGNADTLNLAFTDDQAFIDVAVSAKSGTCDVGETGESYETLTPRQQIVSSAFAINSKTVGGFTPAQSATDSQIPVLTTGGIILGHATTARLASVGTAPFAVDAGSSGILNLNNTSTGDILLGGGSASTGCTLTNSTGAFACTAGITGGAGSFTTLTSSGASTIGTGTSLTNTFGSGASSINTIGSATTPGTLTLLGSTIVAGSANTTAFTLGNVTTNPTLTLLGTGLTTLGGNLTVTGTAWTAIPTISGLITATSGLTSNGAVTVSNNSNLTMSSGTGQFSQTYTGTTTNAFSIASSTLSSGALIDLAITGTAGLTNQKGLNISLSGANATGAQTTYGAYLSNTHTGTSTNVGLYATATGGTNNYAAIFEAGNVGIGTTGPAALLHLVTNNADDSGGIRMERTSATTGRYNQYISSTGDFTLSETAVGTRLTIQKTTGNLGINTTTPLTRLDVAGNVRTTGKATAVLTGTIDPAASTTVTGVGTLFTTELVIGDRITVTGETRTVTAIASNTSLTVDTAFSDNANDTTPDVLYALQTARLSSNAIGLVLNDLGNVSIGSATSATSARISLENTISANSSTTSIAGVYGNYTFNPSAGGTQVGNRFVVNNAPTTTANTAINQIVRTIDNTSLANLVRGMEVVSNAGSNTSGTNTGIRTTGATFGIQAITTGGAGGVAQPAAIYGESTGTTQGDILRLFSSTITSTPQMAYFYHDTSTFTGTGLLMDFAVGTGTFSGNFADFQNNNVTKFKVTNAGVVSMGLSGTASTNAVCSSLANATAPTAGTAYEIRDCNAAPAADYAEMYPVEDGIEFGDIVVTGKKLVMTYGITNGNIDWEKEKGKITKLIKSTEEYQGNVVGIVSDNYGDFSSTGNNIKEKDNPMPVALSGRVPVKIAADSPEILPGDYLTTSGNEPGKATKAGKAGTVIGKALEPWNPDSNKNEIMIFIEQGYYNGPVSDASLAGLTFSPGATLFTSGISFGEQIEFNFPPIFNQDTAGFAIIKEGDRRVRVVFNQAYITSPIVSVFITFEATDNIDDVSADSLFKQNISTIVLDKDETGFTILINKKAPQNIRFSWIALGVKNPKVFESLGAGLTIDSPSPSPSPEPTSETEIESTSEPAPEPVEEEPEVEEEPAPEPEPIPTPEPSP